MKFEVKIQKNMMIRIPAHLVQMMNLKPDDIVDVAIEHSVVELIARSEKFTRYCLDVIGSKRVNELNLAYKETGGLDKHGGFKAWMVKELGLQKYGIKHWTGKGSAEEIFPDGFVPSPDNEKKKK